MKEKLTGVIRTLSNGTLSVITGLAVYTQLDNIRYDFLAWAKSAILSGTLGEYTIWQDAWNIYSQKLTQSKTPDLVSLTSIQELAGQLAKYFVTKYREDGSEYQSISEDCPCKEQLQELVWAAEDEGIGFDNYVYRFVVDSLYAISDAEEGDKLEKYVPDCDVETAVLTDWLNSNIYRVYYLSNVIDDYGDTVDGFQLLGLAQEIEIRYVFNSVCESLRKWIQK